MNGKLSRVRLVIGGTILASLATTAAYAYWSTDGTGTATAKAGTLIPAAVSPLTVSTSKLRPGGPAVSVQITISNPNPSAVTITHLTAGPITSDKPGCGDSADHPTGVTFDLSGISGSVDANDSATFTASANMDLTSVNECQGASFTSALTLAVQS